MRRPVRDNPFVSSLPPTLPPLSNNSYIYYLSTINAMHESQVKGGVNTSNNNSVIIDQSMNLSRIMSPSNYGYHSAVITT